MIPPTTQRVREHSAKRINDRIRRETEANVIRCSAGGPDAIDRRLEELEREWDIERALEANAGTLAAVGAGLSLLVNKKFAVIPLVVGGFLVQHAVQGWCPPVPILRRMGFRTQTEIDHERYALKALRGDFREVRGDDSDAPGRALEAARS
jgi:hypothetical protein